MILSALVLSLALTGSQNAAPSAQAAKPILLNRVFTLGEKLQYSVNSSLHLEVKPYGLQTFMPQDMGLDYRFTSEVKEMKADGIALIHYMRPTMTQIDGETYNSPEKRTVEKSDLNFDLTISPVNAILDEKNLSPKKNPKKTGDGGGESGAPAPAYVRTWGQGQGNSIEGILGQFVSEVYRLALNVGPLDSSLDFSPKLPLDEVSVGDTWKQTVGYEPQKLKDKGNTQAVQKLDYTFTYKGIETVNGKQYYRVSAVLDLKTDLADFVNQLADKKPDETGLKSVPLTLKQTIDYDLDMNSKRTVLARSAADGGFQVNVTEVPDQPVEEAKLKGTTVMQLVSVGKAEPAKGAGKGKGTKRKQ